MLRGGLLWRRLSTLRQTPMHRQYLERKKEYPDCLLLFQVGDFYELFADDARRASHLLNLALTRKAKSKPHQDLDVMCGFPIASLNTYIEKLVRHHGEKVAICNQMESASAAKQRKAVGVQSLVQRHVVRVITPGSLTDDSMLQAGQNNYLAALTILDKPGEVRLAWTDVSTGEFHELDSTMDELESELCRLSPTEMLLPISAKTSKDDVCWQTIESKLPVNCLKTYREYSMDASQMIVDYLKYTHLKADVEASSVLPRMLIDSSAWRSLEITRSMQGNKQHTLLEAIDKTRTAGGARLLAHHLSAPLLRVEDILHRQDGVSWLLEDTNTLSKLRHKLQDCADVERSLRRLSMGGGTPKDLKRISDTILESQVLLEYMNKGRHLWSCDSIKSIRSAFELPLVLPVAHEVQKALVEDITLLNQKQDFVVKGYSKELDHWRGLCQDSALDQVQSLQKEYQSNTKVSKLRVVKKKQQIGWCVEVPQDTTPPLSSPDFQLIQTTTKSLRYRTHALDQLNSDVFHAYEQSIEVEQAIFQHLQQAILGCTEDIRRMTDALGQLDVLSSHAQNALDHQLVRPTFSTTSTEMHIVEGRHLVVQSAHEGNQRAFVPNSLHLIPDTCWIVTGPNMGGKSTFLRQTAHMALLAQMGSFVPAMSAHLGIVDRLFSRVGASDDLASDRSTFMVEMQETATILKQATSRSLVLMDEVGRGTSVQDGVAIAQAVVEELLKRQTRTLFATHFTELSNIFEQEPTVSFHHMQVARHRKAGLIFSHRVVPGVAKESYGVEVAALAGCPVHVVERAKALVQAQRQKSVPLSIDQSNIE